MIRKSDSLEKLENDVVKCDRCPRLRKYCAAVAKEKRRAFLNDTYWGKPIPDFGSGKASPLLIVGLAPAAHGANRTGRMFTGDRSGEWLYRALHKAGFANQAQATGRTDGLKLIGCTITAVAHCAPPDNKPTNDEIKNCSEYFERAMRLHNPKVILALGGIAWNAVFDEMKRQGSWNGKRPVFSHGAEVQLSKHQTLIGSYHPSQQNTFTKRLTEPMFDAVFARANALMNC